MEIHSRLSFILYNTDLHCKGPVCCLPSCKCTFSAGLFPGTEYQISVQAIQGTTEGQSSTVTAATGQCQTLARHANILLAVQGFGYDEAQNTHGKHSHILSDR